MSETIISEDELSLSFTFASQGTLSLFKALLVILVLLSLYIFRKRIGQLFQSLRDKNQLRNVSIMFLVVGVLALVYSMLAAFFLFAAALVMFVLSQVLKSKKEEK